MKLCIKNPPRILTGLALALLLLAAAGDQYEVVGAGSTDVNGVYTWVADGKYAGPATYYLCFNSSYGGYWLIVGAEAGCTDWSQLYYSNQSPSPPPPEMGWAGAMNGVDPAPTVARYILGAKIEKSVTSASRLVAPGQSVTYTLKVNNTYTETITGVAITDTLSAEVINTSVSSSDLTLTPVGGARYAWQVADLSAGRTGYITITGIVSPTAAEGSLNNTAEITASQGGGSKSAAFLISWWRPVGTEGFSAGSTVYTSLALDSNNVPYVAYQDGNASAEVTVKRYISGTWQTVGAEGFSAGQVEDISLALDSNNVPYVAYRDYGNSSKTTVMRYYPVTDTWQAVGTPAFSSDWAKYVSLALNTNNVPYVAYVEGGNNATVKRYNSGSNA
jgi:uncharacterized repeat protein (TIGR01451 family)